MLEIKFRSFSQATQDMVAYFPLGTNLKVRNKNSQFAGLIEEFELQADDLKNSRFIFQHDGRGHLVWISFENDLATLPWQTK